MLSSSSTSLAFPWGLRTFSPFSFFVTGALKGTQQTKKLRILGVLTFWPGWSRCEFFVLVCLIFLGFTLVFQGKTKQDIRRTLMTTSNKLLSREVLHCRRGHFRPERAPQRLSFQDFDVFHATAHRATVFNWHHAGTENTHSTCSNKHNCLHRVLFVECASLKKLFASWLSRRHGQN